MVEKGNLQKCKLPNVLLVYPSLKQAPQLNRHEKQNRIRTQLVESINHYQEILE